MLDLCPQEPAEGKTNGGQKAAERREMQGTPREGIREETGEESVQGNGNIDQLWCRQPGYGYVQWI